MSHSFNAVRKIRHSLVRPSRHGVRIVAVMIAMTFGLAGNFMETNHELKELDIGNLVEQIQSTLERRESIKEIEAALKMAPVDLV